MSCSFSLFARLGDVRGDKPIEETRQQIKDAGEKMNFPFEFSEVQGDEFKLELPHCPYGFSSPDHRRPCDTAMDMDRMLFSRCGVELIITDTLPKGADKCRMIVRKVSAAD